MRSWTVDHWTWSELFYNLLWIWADLASFPYIVAIWHNNTNHRAGSEKHVSSEQNRSIHIARDGHSVSERVMCVLTSFAKCLAAICLLSLNVGVSNSFSTENNVCDRWILFTISNPFSPASLATLFISSRMAALTAGFATSAAKLLKGILFFFAHAVNSSSSGTIIPTSELSKPSPCT